MLYATNMTSIGKGILGYSDYFGRWVDRTPNNYLAWTINEKRKQCQAVWGKTKHERRPIRYSRFHCYVSNDNP